MAGKRVRRIDTRPRGVSIGGSTTLDDGASKSPWRQRAEDAFGIATRRLLDHAESVRLGEGPVVGIERLPEIRERLDLDRYLREGGLSGAHLDEFLDVYLAHSTRLQHPGYLAHQVASVEPVTAIADLVHGVINNPMAIYEMGPSAATVETAVVEWMLGKVGFDNGAAVLTHGGSLANLTAMLAARAAIAPEAWEQGAPSDLAILAPHISHYSVARAVSIMGLGTNALVPLEVDSLERLMPDRLATAIERTRAEGKRVMAVVANACATSTGLHDPIEPLARICQDAGVWFHVDAAHGASALLSESERHWLEGIHLADSLVWDAHKMLRTSTLCAAVLFRQPERFQQAFHQKADYLFYSQDQAPDTSLTLDEDEPDLISRTVECTKAELGLKLFLSLAIQGEAGLARYIDSRYEATRRFYKIIRERRGFECPYRPEANILCFRFLGNDHDPSTPTAAASLDTLQIRIRDHLLRSGSFYLSSTTIGPRRYLRMSVMSAHTDDASIEAMLDAIEETARTLKD